MNNIKLSIIIPFQDVQNYFEQALRSVVNQTLKEIEIICINDCSKDSSSEIVRNYMANDNRIKLIELEERKGQGFARNIGINYANGEYIGFVDSDDWVEEAMFEKMYNRAKEFDSDITMCKTILFDESTQQEINNGYYQLEALNNFKGDCFNAYDTKKQILNINVAIWNKIYKKELFKDLNIKFPEGVIYEDLPFFFEMYLKAKNISIVDENLYYYRINRPGSTMQNIGEKICDRIEMLNLTYNKVKESIIYDLIESDFLNWIIDDIFHRASLINFEFFGKYFDKAKELLKNIGFTDKNNMLGKGIVFLDEVIFWMEQTPEDALFFVRTFRTTDKKLDKLYVELTNCYQYIDKKNDTTDIQRKIYEIKNDSEKWFQYYNKELKKIYIQFTNQSAQFDKNMKKMLYVQEQEMTEEQNKRHHEIEERLNFADINIQEKMKGLFEEQEQLFKIKLEEQKQEIEEKYNKKLNDQRVIYERKLVKLENDYEDFYKKLDPVIRLLRYFGLYKEKNNDK